MSEKDNEADVTQLLRAVGDGDRDASSQLLTRVYEELRRLAGGKMAREAPGNTLQATALVHEAWMLLTDEEGRAAFKNRAHFFGAASEAMRRILVDRARKRRLCVPSMGAVQRGLRSCAAFVIVYTERIDDRCAIMKLSHSFLAWALWASGLAAAEPVGADSPWDDLPKEAGVDTLVKRVPNPEPPRPKDALVGRGLLMPTLWHLGHGQLRLRQGADPKNAGTEFLFDDKGRVFVLVRWRDEFEEKALKELGKVGAVVAEPKHEIRFEQGVGHLPGDFRQLDEGKTVVMRGCFVPPKRILELIDQPVIRYIQMTKAKR